MRSIFLIVLGALLLATVGCGGGGGKLTWNRFTGPGQLALQTMFIAPLEGVESGVGTGGQVAGAAGVGALLGRMLE